MGLTVDAKDDKTDVWCALFSSSAVEPINLANGDGRMAKFPKQVLV